MFIRYIVLTCLVIISMNVNALDSTGDEQPSDSARFLDNLDIEKSEMQIAQDEDGAITKAEYRELQETHRFYLIAAMIGITPIFLLILLYFIRKSNEFTENAILHSSGLVLVIQATVIVVIAAPTTEQLTAAIGVLAAIAGYLFGSAKRTKSE